MLVVSYISLHIVSCPQLSQCKFIFKVLLYSRRQMLKASHVFSTWCLYCACQIFKNVMSISATSDFMSFFARKKFRIWKKAAFTSQFSCFNYQWLQCFVYCQRLFQIKILHLLHLSFFESFCQKQFQQVFSKRAFLKIL